MQHTIGEKRDDSKHKLDLTIGFGLPGFMISSGAGPEVRTRNIGFTILPTPAEIVTFYGTKGLKFIQTGRVTIFDLSTRHNGSDLSNP